jgi:hypothetical protein
MSLTAAVIRFDVQQPGTAGLDPPPEIFDLFLSPNGKMANRAVRRNPET